MVFSRKGGVGIGRKVNRKVVRMFYDKLDTVGGSDRPSLPPLCRLLVVKIRDSENTRFRGACATTKFGGWGVPPAWVTEPKVSFLNDKTFVLRDLDIVNPPLQTFEQHSRSPFDISSATG